MTNEEVLKLIEDGRIISIQIKANDEETSKYNLKNLEALNMIIKTLKKEPTIKIEESNFSQEQYKADLECAYDCGRASVKPCEDAISRDELLKAINTWDKFGCDADTKLVPYQDHYIPYIHYDDVVKCIKGMPSVTPKPKTGHWIEDGYYDLPCVCSYCGHEGRYDMKFCPNCGAKMTESEVEE